MNKNCILIDTSRYITPEQISEIEEFSFFNVRAVSSYESAQYYLNSKSFDIILHYLDIFDLKGFEFLKYLPSNIPIVLISSFEQFALQTYEMENVIDFILAPFKNNRLLKSFDKLSGVMETSNIILEGQFLFFRVGREVAIINIHDIDYIVAYGNHSKLFVGFKDYLIKDSISILANVLPTSLFRRIHRSYIVNLFKIKRFNAKTITINSTTLPMGNLFKRSLSCILKKHSV